MSDYDESRPYVGHLIAEHRRLHRLLCSMRAALVHSVGPDGNRSFADVTTTLQRLRDELSQHFTEEEEGGCMDEAVSRCPRLAGEERRIEAEHPEILARIDRLRKQAATWPATTRNQIALQGEFRGLCDQICAHERAENRLLADAFGIGVGDDNGSAASHGMADHV